MESEARTVLRMTGCQHARFMRHLFPGDGREAVAVAACGRRSGAHTRCLMVREILEIPHDRCRTREASRLEWPTEHALPLIRKAAEHGWGMLKIHSHPNGYRGFSKADTCSDRALFPSLHGWTDTEHPHASAVMLPDGTIFGRIFESSGAVTPLHTVAVAGDDLLFWHHGTSTRPLPEAALRNVQAFGRGTVDALRKLSIAVVGASGTGSVVIEQLARLSVGRLLLIDPDRVEEKNLNRILNTNLEDARKRRLKVEVLARAVNSMGLGTLVEEIPKNLAHPEIVKAVAECDVLFGCMDSADGRHLLNRLSVFYSLPYFDLGVKLIADGRGGIEQICGTVHYLQPDGSSLMSRKAVNLEQVAAASLRRHNPAEYRERLKAKYIEGIQEDSPAVISVNMQIAAMGVNEFLARLHPYRDDGNAGFAVNRISLTQSQGYTEHDGEPCPTLSIHAGRGDVRPLLDMPELSEARA